MRLRTAGVAIGWLNAVGAGIGLIASAVLLSQKDTLAELIVEKEKMEGVSKEEMIKSIYLTGF